MMRINLLARVGLGSALILLTAPRAACLAGETPTPPDWPPAPPLEIVPDTSPGALPPSVVAGDFAGGRWRCTFTFQPDAAAKAVTLAGTFNNWSPDAMPMTRANGAGPWSATADLPAGVHEYKFVVDGDRWLPDPQNPDRVSDGRNGQNTVLRLGRLAHLKESAAKVGDAQIDGLALEHRPEAPLYFQRLDGHAQIRLRTLSHDVDSVWVAVQGAELTEMSAVAPGEPFTLWEGTARLPAGVGGDGLLHYTFILADGNLRVSSPEIYGVPVSQTDIFKTPEWAKHAIWYQIMLDRFRNGNPADDPNPVCPWTCEWFTTLPWEGKDGQTFYKHFVFDRLYGGDFDGLEEKLPYLKELGVNAIYLLPVFKAQSSHKYNATNYLHVDDHFGTKGDYEAAAAKEDLTDPSTWIWTESDKRFLRFIKAAHAQGFKVIIDGVFNHVGTAHPAFQDVVKHGKESKYADWFNITSWNPVKYEGWAGFDALPVFKKSKDGLACPAVKEHIFAVTRRWMAPDGDVSAGIDGWRLDVPNEIAAPFWVEWRKLVKGINPDAYISGEIWDRAEQWLDGQHFDAVMNYEFARPTVAWLFNHKLKIGPSEIDRRLRELRLAYPLEATLVLQNLLDSHDTDRVASMALNPDRPYNEGNRPQLDGVKYDNAKPGAAEYARARLAALLQMTYIGAPMIWYGDEAGVWGAADPTGRKPMLWEDLEPYEKPEENFVMKDQLAFYEQIIALRRAHPALQTGTFQTLLADDDADVWAFRRRDDNEQLVVVLNASDHPRTVVVPLPPSAPNKWKGVFNAEGDVGVTEHKISVQVPPISGVVLHAGTPK